MSRAAPGEPGGPVNDARLYEVRGPTRTARGACWPLDHVARRGLAAGDYYERDLLDALRALDPRGVAVDVGAHVGNHTAYLALETDVDSVVAIEPCARTFAVLRRTV